MIELNSVSPVAERQFLEWEMKQVETRCQAPLDRECLAKRKRSCNLSDSEVKSIYDMGFRHYKLQGRVDNPVIYIYDVIRYSLDPHFVAPLVFKTMVRNLFSGRKP